MYLLFTLTSLEKQKYLQKKKKMRNEINKTKKIMKE